MFKYLCLGFALLTVVFAQRRQQGQGQGYNSNTTPVPILRQINTHNQDGSYTYGYEAADGSYKIENKLATGDVKGKYGYYDDAGQLREIEYGATRDGFNPTGTGINVPPPAPVNRQYNPTTGADYDDDGQYRPDEHEAPYAYKPDTTSGQNLVQSLPQQQRFASSRGLNFPRQQQQQPQQQQEYYQPQEYVQPAPAPRPRFQNQVPPTSFFGHPATNINLNSGSYSLNY